MEITIATRAEDYSRWYTDVIAAAQLADYAPVKGCMVIRPNGYAIWERMQRALDDMFKETGHRNAYFPLFIPESFLKKEAEHVEGFAPECAVVTHGGGKKLDEPLFVRPTSETIIWDSYRNWIQSYRDLPLLINQWCNIVRWEMRTRLFLRTTEFLWQEGHTAHATEEDARQEAMRMLHVYRRFAEEWMALPVLYGEKTAAQKFAGAIRTHCIEAMMQDGKALQAGTSHELGQNFARAFNVTFLNEKGGREFVWATSWGVSTRLIGALIMAHSDDKGLVLPPKLAPIEVRVIPVFAKQPEKVGTAAEALRKELSQTLRVDMDARESASPGWRFVDWERSGIPLRVEVGPRDIDNHTAMVVRRDTGEKTSLPREGLADRLAELLMAVQKNLYDRALAFRNAHTYQVDDYEDFKRLIDERPGFYYAHWNGSSVVEAKIQEETKATIRVLEHDVEASPGKCMVTGEPSSRRVVFAKAY
ncbi:proline--tRNA ligase [bacterium]|nr:proline--tRNA ligase [bacterium]